MLRPCVVSDGSSVTSRWYMDAGAFAGRFADELLNGCAQKVELRVKIWPDHHRSLGWGAIRQGELNDPSTCRQKEYR